MSPSRVPPSRGSPPHAGCAGQRLKIPGLELCLLSDVSFSGLLLPCLGLKRPLYLGGRGIVHRRDEICDVNEELQWLTPAFLASEARYGFRVLGDRVIPLKTTLFPSLGLSRVVCEVEEIPNQCKSPKSLLAVFRSSSCGMKSWQNLCQTRNWSSADECIVDCAALG